LAPFIAVSPFSRPQYVSHTVADHTSILAFIEALFTPHQHLTERDRRANESSRQGFQVRVSLPSVLAFPA
jgi:hypothetical protein